MRKVLSSLGYVTLFSIAGIAVVLFGAFLAAAHVTGVIILHFYESISNKGTVTHG